MVGFDVQPILYFKSNTKSQWKQNQRINRSRNGIVQVVGWSIQEATLKKAAVLGKKRRHKNNDEATRADR